MQQVTETIIYKEIKQAILKRKLRPNTQLVEDVLAESFGVSRTLIRQALRRLSYEKIVNIVPNKGSFVACPSIEEAEQIINVRRALEIESARLVCKTITDQQINQLEKIINEERNFALAGNKFDSLQLALDFHIEMAEFTRNSYLYRYIEELASLVYVIVTFYGAENLFCGYEDHEEILNAIKQRDKQKTVNLTIKHFNKFDPTDLDNGPQYSISLQEIFKKNNHAAKSKKGRPV